MTDSSLILLIKKFDKHQLKEFNNFVKSPFFNTNNALIKLYEYIRKLYPDYNPEKLEKKMVYKKIFGKTEYNDGFIRVLMSNLQSLAEEYLTYTEFQRSPLIKKKYLLDKLNYLGARKHAEKILSEGLKESAKLTPENPDDYLGMYYMSFYKRYLYSTQFVVSKNNKPDDTLYDEQKYFTYSFLLRTLANHFYHLNQKQVINYEPKLIFLDEIVTFLEKNPEFLEAHILNITYLRVLLLKNNKIEDYYRLKKVFYEIYDKIDKKDAFNTVSIILNYCQKNYASTNDELFQSEKYEILKFAVENKLNTFDKNEGFDSSRFYNIVNTALDFDEVEWAENFIKHYGRELRSGKREYLVTFTNAMISFAKKNYDEALVLLARLQNPTVATEKFNLKILQLRIYFEKNYYDQAESTVDSFKHLIQNDKVLPESNKESHKNFYYFYQKLLLLKQKNERSAIPDLKEKLNSTTNIVNKKWFIEKMKEAEEQ